MSPVFLAAMIGGVLGALVLAHRQGRLLRGAVLAMAALVVAWLLNLLLVWQNVGESAGFIDCRDCTAAQDAAGTVFFWAPMLFLLLGGVLLFAFLGRARQR